MAIDRDMRNAALRAAAKMGVVALLLMGCTAAGPLTATSTVDDVLDAMHDRGGDLKSFTADLTQSNVDLNQDTRVTHRGHVTFEALPGGDARLHLVLDSKTVGKRKPTAEKKEYLLADGVLIDRDYDQKSETPRRVTPPGQRVNLFQLGKGTFPLPIGQDRAAVLQQFTVTMVPPDQGDPANSLHLQLVPRPNTRLAEQFSQVDFWVDMALRMPVRVKTLDTHQTIEQTNDLTNLKLNPPVTNADFTLPPVGTDWRIAPIQ